MKTFKEFKETIQKVKGNRKHKATNSIGVYDAYKWLRKNRWKHIGQALKEHEFYTIIREVNKLLADNLTNGKEVNLPCRMGTLELRKRLPKTIIKGDEVINTYSIGWLDTLKLWYEDEEARANKSLIKLIDHEIFKVFYNKAKATYNNKLFYKFGVNRKIKEILKERIRNKEVDAYEMGRVII